MTRRIDVGTITEFEDNPSKTVAVNGAEIGVFKVNGKFYAISNVCAHEYGPVCEGDVRGRLVAEYRGPEQGVIESVTDDPCIACPWHGWEYDLETGVHLGDESISIPVYPVIVEDDVVYVQV